MKEIVIYLTTSIKKRKKKKAKQEDPYYREQVERSNKSTWLRRNIRFLASQFPTFMWLVNNNEAQNLTYKNWSTNIMTTNS